MKRITVFLFLVLLSVPSFAQRMVELKQVNMSRWGIGVAQYSGITSMGGNRYALVSDDEPSDGFFLFRIDQNSRTGEVEAVYMEGFKGHAPASVDGRGKTLRDEEGIAWFAPLRTLFVSGEGDQQILEYDIEGKATGRRLSVPDIMSRDRISPGYGFEALAYDTAGHRFWTTTESTLLADGGAAGPSRPGGHNLLRLQSFNDDLAPDAQYAYRMDRGMSEDFGRTYVYGVPALTCLPNGKLLVLEREANVSQGYLSSEVTCKIFIVNPAEGYRIDSSTDITRLDSNRFLVKDLLCKWTTRLTPFNQSFANYEGMCLGRTLEDGRQTLLLVNDSQGGFGYGPVRLKDYIKVIVLANPL